jgi:hypothetical protein
MSKRAVIANEVTDLLVGVFIFNGRARATGVCVRSFGRRGGLNMTGVLFL